MEGKMQAVLKQEWVTPRGNWNGPRDWLPRIEVDQGTGEVTVTRFDTVGHQKKATVDTISCEAVVAVDGMGMVVRGEVAVRNWVQGWGEQRQKFCFAIFVGDSGHIYIHRAPATKGWMECEPGGITKRLRKLGIGADRGVVQQGDFLLKPANGGAYPTEMFKHETMGAGHHKFAAPVLYADGAGGRQYRVTETVLLRHEAVDGIQHPDVLVEPGVYVVGTTASGLRHSNKRD